ncbi:hypothetical protein ETH_00041040, partial [Eimeria tenella]
MWLRVIPESSSSSDHGCSCCAAAGCKGGTPGRDLIANAQRRQQEQQQEEVSDSSGGIETEDSANTAAVAKGRGTSRRMSTTEATIAATAAKPLRCKRPLRAAAAGERGSAGLQSSPTPSGRRSSKRLAAAKGGAGAAGVAARVVLPIARPQPRRSNSSSRSGSSSSRNGSSSSITALRRDSDRIKSDTAAPPEADRPGNAVAVGAAEWPPAESLQLGSLTI